MDLMSLLARLTLDKSQFDDGLKEAEKDASGLKVPQPVIPKPDTQPLKDGLAEAEDEGNIFKEIMSGVWSGVKDAILATGVVGVVTSIIGYMKQGISLAITGGKEISDGAKGLQISTKAYQEYEYALGKSGLRAKDLTKAMTGLEKIYSGNISKGQEKFVEELEEAGLQIDNAASKEERLKNLMSTIADYQGEDKGLIIDWLFGGNANWTTFFDQTADDIEGLKKEAEKYGQIMDDDSVQNAVEFSEATEQISQRMEAIQRSFGESIVPMLTDAANKVLLIMDLFAAPGKSLSEKLTEGDEEFAGQLLTIEGTAAAAETLVDKLLQMGDTSKMTAEQYEIWKGTAQALIDIVPTLGDVIDTETGQIQGNSESLKENIRQWEELAKQKALQSLKEKKYQQLVESNQELIDANVGLNVKEAEASQKKAEAIAKANEMLQKSSLKNGFKNTFGTDELTTYAQVQWLAEASRHYTGFGDLQGYINAYIEADNEAKAAGDNVKTLTEQLEEGKKQYADWVQAAEEMYGLSEAQTDAASSGVQEYISWLDRIPDEKRTLIITEYEERNSRPMAIGGTIPYDNYPALLHRGERVLTAAEVRKSESSPDYSAMEDRIVAAINRGMENATVRSYLNGKDITDDVNRRNMEGVKGRRFAG